jgi:hypothetical protein
MRSATANGFANVLIWSQAAIWSTRPAKVGDQQQGDHRGAR